MVSPHSPNQQLVTASDGLDDSTLIRAVDYQSRCQSYTRGTSRVKRAKLLTTMKSFRSIAQKRQMLPVLLGPWYPTWLCRGSAPTNKDEAGRGSEVKRYALNYVLNNRSYPLRILRPYNYLLRDTPVMHRIRCNHHSMYPTPSHFPTTYQPSAYPT